MPMNLYAELSAVISLWPLWLFLLGVAVFVALTKSVDQKKNLDILDNQTQDQRHVNSIGNFGSGNDL